MLTRKNVVVKSNGEWHANNTNQSDQGRDQVRAECPNEHVLIKSVVEFLAGSYCLLEYV